MASRASLGKFFRNWQTLEPRTLYLVPRSYLVRLYIVRVLRERTSEVIWTANTEDVIRHALLSSAPAPELPSSGGQVQRRK